MSTVPPASSSQGSPQAAEEVPEERLTDKVIQQHPRTPPSQPIKALCGASSPTLAFELSRTLTTKSVPGITQSQRILLLDPTLPFCHRSRAPRAEGELFRAGSLPGLLASDSGDPGGSQNSLSGEQAGVSASGVSKLSVESELPKGGKRVRNYCFQGYL